MGGRRVDPFDFNYYSALFGQQERSDCVVEFYHTAQLPQHDELAAVEVNAGQQLGEPPQKRHKTAHDGERLVLASLPAHTLLLCARSLVLRARIERWPRGNQLVLDVKLDTLHDLQHAESALKYIYTDELTGADSITEILNVRKYAAILGIDGCLAACDTTIKARFQTSSGPEGSLEALSGVLELYQARGLLPDRTAEQPVPVAETLLHACRQQLVRHSRTGRIEGAVPEATPSLGELLGWAFGDAPFVLNEREVRRQMLQLSAAAMEALLGSSSFGTDSEDSVLLMAATWLQYPPVEATAGTAGANRTPGIARAVSESDVKRVCKQLRLRHLSKAYLHVILPNLEWFPITKEEYRYLTYYVAAPDVVSKDLTPLLFGDRAFAFPPSWNTRPARPPTTSSPRMHEWHITQEELREKLKSTSASGVVIPVNLDNGGDCVVSLGFELVPWVVFSLSMAWLVLRCRLPPALHCAMAPREAIEIKVPHAGFQLVAHSWREDGTRGPEAGQVYGKGCVAIGNVMGWYPKPTCLPLKADVEGEGAGAGGKPDPLWRFSACLHEGKMSGVFQCPGD